MTAKSGQRLSARRTPPMIRAEIGDSLIDLTTLNPQKDLIEKSFDLEPRQLQSAIETGSFEITEMFDQSVQHSVPGVQTRTTSMGADRISYGVMEGYDGPKLLRGRFRALLQCTLCIVG